MASTKPTIEYGTLIAMIMVSLFFDILQFFIDFIPVIGWIINIVVIDSVALLIFWFWFKTKGVKFSGGGANNKTLFAFIGGYILDFVPFVSGLAWTIDVLSVYATSRTPIVSPTEEVVPDQQQVRYTMKYAGTEVDTNDQNSANSAVAREEVRKTRRAA